MSTTNNTDQNEACNKHNEEYDPRQIESNNMIVLPSGKRWGLFSIMAVICLLTNIDHGTIPAATAQIRNDLNISDAILGLFGSAVYAGTIIGSLILISLINISNRKYLILTSIIASGICMLLFTIKQHYILLFINRGIAGLFQTALSIYLPVWTDQFGDDNKKTMMVAVIQLFSPLGIVLGYTLTTIFAHNYGWKMSFIIEAVSTIALSLSLGLFPDIYFKSSIRKYIKTSNDKGAEKTLYFYDEDKAHTSNPQLKEANSITKLLQQFKVIFKEPIYIFSVLSLSTLLYIATAIQYWASDYMLDTLNIVSEKQRLALFVIICLTSATFGVIIIGLIISCLGGYESKRSTAVCLLFCIILSISSIPIPLVNNILLCGLSLWLLLFFGGGIIAPLIGIIITSVPKDYAGSANSICHLLYNIIGKLPAPYVYGIIKTHSNGRVAMMASMYMSFVAVAFMAITTLLRNKHYMRIQRYAMVDEVLKTDIDANVNKIELSERKGMDEPSPSKPQHSDKETEDNSNGNGVSVV